MTSYAIEFPEGFDEYDSAMLDAKGWLTVLVTIQERQFEVTFYDPVRLSQEIQGGLKHKGMYLGGNMVVLQSLDRTAIENAVATIADAGTYAEWVPQAQGAGWAG
jgi:hypothetical protein